jgi:hypothetical protein
VADARAQAEEGECKHRPVLFLHVMKTGGATLVHHLEERYEREEIWPDPSRDYHYDGPRMDLRLTLSVPNLARLPAERRRRIRIYRGHLPYVSREFLGGDLDLVTILRDPIDRTESLLRQFRRTVPSVQDPARRPPLADASLEEIYDHPSVFRPLVLNHQTKLFSMRTSDDPRSYLDLVDVDAERLAAAKANLATVDVVGLTERYQEFLDDLEARFGWTVPREARQNVTPPDDDEPLSDELRRRIASDNAIDVELYAYAKELVELRRRRSA